MKSREKSELLSTPNIASLALGVHFCPLLNYFFLVKTIVPQGKPSFVKGDTETISANEPNWKINFAVKEGKIDLNSKIDVQHLIITSRKHKLVLVLIHFFLPKS